MFSVDGASIQFFCDSTGGTARVEIFGDGTLGFTNAELQIDGHNAPGVMIGSIEGMMRDQLIAGSNFPANYSVEQVRSTLAILIASVCDVQRPSMGPERRAGDRIGVVPTEDDWIRYYLKLADRALIPSDLS